MFVNKSLVKLEFMSVLVEILVKLGIFRNLNFIIFSLSIFNKEVYFGKFDGLKNKLIFMIVVKGGVFDGKFLFIKLNNKVSS